MTGCGILDSGIAARKNGKRLPCEVLEAENAKLRMLCADMFEDCVDECDKWRYADRMRELGIEVPA